MISISDYETSPNNYKRVKYEHHSEDLIKACGDCSKLLCEKCNVKGPCTGRPSFVSRKPK